MPEIRNSSIGRYKIYQDSNEYYLIDSKYTFSPLSLFVAPHLFKLSALQLNKNLISTFEKKRQKLLNGIDNFCFNNPAYSDFNI